MKWNNFFSLAFLVSTITLLSGCFCNQSDLLTNTWVLEKYGAVDALENVLDPSSISPPGKAEILLLFPEENRFAGNDGCNQIFGAYEMVGKCKIRFDSINTTLMMCQQEIMQQASQYTTILKKVESFKVKNGKLELFTPGAEVLIYKQK